MIATLGLALFACIACTTILPSGKNLGVDVFRVEVVESGDSSSEMEVRFAQPPERDQLLALLVDMLAKCERDSDLSIVAIHCLDDNQNEWRIMVKAKRVSHGRMWYTCSQELSALTTVIFCGTPVKARYDDRNEFLHDVVDYPCHYDLATPGKYP